MTAYRIAPVDTRADWGRGQVVDVPSREDLWRQVEQLQDELERARTHAANEGQWKAIALRRAAESRAVLRELAGRSPDAARAVDAAKAKVRRAGTWTS